MISHLVYISFTPGNNHVWSCKNFELLMALSVENRLIKFYSLLLIILRFISSVRVHLFRLSRSPVARKSVTREVGSYRPSTASQRMLNDRNTALQWLHNEGNGISNHQPHDCLLNCIFRHRSKKTSKLPITGLCVGKSPVTSEFPTQMASNAESVSIWWRHHGERNRNVWLLHFIWAYFIFHQITLV